LCYIIKKSEIVQLINITRDKVDLLKYFAKSVAIIKVKVGTINIIKLVS